MSAKSLGTLTLDLIVQTGGFESGMDRAARLADQKTRQIERQAAERAKAIEAAFSSMARSIATPLATAFGVAGISAFVSSLTQAQQQADKLRNSLTYSAGSATAANKELAYLRETTRALGLDFNTASQAYAKFAAATKGSGISAEQTRTVFEGVAAASSKMGLSADETQGALLALSQMASKGTVSAEELRGQLGERLPGAFKIAAQSMGVTQAELGKMLETGQILASDFLPKFGQALKNEFAGSVTSLTQELNRLNSSWDIWKQNFSNADGGGFKWITNGINESSAAMRALGQEAGIVQKVLAAIGGFQFGAVGAGKFDTQKVQEQAFQALAEIKAQRQQLEEQQQKYGSLPPITNRRLESLKREEQALRDEINALAVQRGKEVGFNKPDIAGDLMAQKAKADERMKAYLADTSNAPKAAKLAAEIEKENKSFQEAVTGLSETDSRYIAALRAHNERVSTIKEKAGKEQISEGQRLIEQMQGRLTTAQHLTEVEKLNLELTEKKYAKITPAERENATTLAQQIDYRATIQQQLDDEIGAARKLTQEYEAQSSRLKSLIGATPFGQNVQRMQDEALAESALTAGKIDTTTYDQIIAKLHEVKDEGKDSFKELQQAIEGFGRESAGALVDFLSGTETSFKATVASMLKEMAKLMVYQNITKPLAASFSGLFSGALSGLFSGGSGSDVIPMQPGGGYAKGDVFTSPSLHEYVNTVQSTPTLFAFAKGGVFGEAGPEAVMPLKRGSDGSLGVRATGGTGDVNISITVNDSGGTTQKASGDTNAAWAQFAGRVKVMIIDEINNQKRRGGALYA